MSGIEYITDETGRRVAVQIDLQQHRELWEDFEDSYMARERASEDSVPYDRYRSERLSQRRPRA